MPGQNPVPPPEEPAEARDERTATDNERRNASRRKLLDLQEAANAIRVHLPVALVDEAAEHGMEFVMEERRDDEQKSGE